MQKFLEVYNEKVLKLFKFFKVPKKFYCLKIWNFLKVILKDYEVNLFILYMFFYSKQNVHNFQNKRQ